MHFLTPADLRGLSAESSIPALEELLGRTDLTIAMGEGEVGGLAAAALLFADFAVLREGAVLRLDVAQTWAGAVWRLGRGALKLLAAPALTAREALDAGLCDDVTTREPAEWLEEWTRHRSVIALDAAAALIRSRGGDRLERAEFARLFALGEPQKGLGAFLAKKRPEF